MPSQGLYEIEKNLPLARDVYELTLRGDTGALERPGQFVNIKIQGLYLRRPISVCAWSEGRMALVYKVVGKGTAAMARMGPGEVLDLLTGLGNGFEVAPAKGKRVALVGGGVGVPPLYGVMEALAGEDVTCVMGFQSAQDVFYVEQFQALGARVLVTTADGSLGRRGLVTDALRETDCGYYFACGPRAMLRAVQSLGGAGQLSLEERMGCGFGACMGCTCETKAGPRRVCCDGPVFESGGVLL